MIVQEKCFSCYILWTDQIPLSDCFSFIRYWEYAYCNCLFPGCDVINFQINSIVLIKLFFCMPRISRQKILEVEGIKSVFHHFLKGFQLLLLLLFCFFFPDFLKFFSDLKVRLLSRLATREAITNNYDSFHLWWKRNLAKHQKISKYYDHDCGL